MWSNRKTYVYTHTRVRAYNTLHARIISLYLLYRAHMLCGYQIWLRTLSIYYNVLTLSIELSFLRQIITTVSPRTVTYRWSRHSRVGIAIMPGVNLNSHTFLLSHTPYYITMLPLHRECDIYTISIIVTYWHILSGLARQ